MEIVIGMIVVAVGIVLYLLFFSGRGSTRVELDLGPTINQALSKLQANNRERPILSIPTGVDRVTTTASGPIQIAARRRIKVGEGHWVTLTVTLVSNNQPPSDIENFDMAVIDSRLAARDRAAVINREWFTPAGTVTMFISDEHVAAGVRLGHTLRRR